MADQAKGWKSVTLTHQDYTFVNHQDYSTNDMFLFQHILRYIKRTEGSIFVIDCLRLRILPKN